MGAIDTKLAALGLELPQAPAPAANYVPALRSSNLIYIAGQVCFGPDGKLYVAVGENAVPSNAQTLANLLGKILRIRVKKTIYKMTKFWSVSNSRAH